MSARTGRFLSDLLRGADALDAASRRSLGNFFVGVVEQRRLPLHTAVLWNSLYFSWDLEQREYLGRGVRLEPADDGRPIPVGAFVQVPAGQSPLYGEVVYKEGRDGDAQDETGLVDAVASGRRAGRNATGETADVREALVIDFDAFGSDLHEYGTVEFRRFVRHGWLDANLHRVVTATYLPDDPADDLSVYARYLLDAYGQRLFAEFLADGEPLTGPEERELLLRSFESVHAIAKASPDLLRVGDYWIARSLVDEAYAAPPDAPLSGADLRALVRRAADLPARVRTGYTAVGPLVISQLLPQGISPEEEALLRGPAYARLVTIVNAGLADRVGEDGLLNERRHLRLDDDWNWGGIWRVERYAGRPPDHARFHPLMPLGLGYAGQSVRLPGAALYPSLPPQIEVADRHWVVKLRQDDLDEGQLPLSAAAVASLTGADRVIVDLGVAGERSQRATRPLDRESHMLREVDYPVDFFPGLRLSCTVSGNGMVTARAHRLAVPERVEEMQLLFEFDRDVLDRELGLRPLPPRKLAGGRTLADQIAVAFRLRGRPTPDGGFALTEPEVVVALAGREASHDTAAAIVIGLQGIELDRLGDILVWHPRVSRRTSARERQRVAASRETNRGKRLSRLIRPHEVAMHLRQYTQRRPSADKRAAYELALRNYHAEHRLPPKLPVGATWVKPYPTGRRAAGAGPPTITLEF